MNRATKLAFGAIALAFSSQSFGQVAVLPGTTVFEPILTTSPVLGYTLVAESASIPFTGVNALGQTEFTGHVLSAVLQASPGSDLVFAYLFDTDATSANAITSLSVSHFAGFTTSVAQVADGDGAFTASRTATGDVLTFGFLPGAGAGYNEVNPGDLADPELVFTDATSYTIGSAQFSGSGIATEPVYAPAATPEPAPFLAVGLGLIGLIRRRARR